ncbi:hypothetical protein Gpo141_00009183 [Globisporangium polare]
MTGSSASASAASAASASAASAESTSGDSGVDVVAFTLSATSSPSPSPEPTPTPTPDTPAPTEATSPPSSSVDNSSASTYLRSPSAAPDNRRDESGNDHRTPGSDCRSGSKSSTSDETPEQQLNRRRTTGTCSSYPSKFRECAEPRSCFDCLNFVVTTEVGGCMLNEYGRCVAVRDNWNPSQDFSRFQPANANDSAVTANTTKVASTGSSSGSSGSSSTSGATVQLPPPKDPRYQFRADKAEYCNKDDALCSACRRTVFADFIEGVTDHGRSAYCVGEGGCICIAVCEARRDHPPPPPNKDCFAKSLAANKKETKTSAGAGPWASVSAILGAMLFVVITVFAIYRIRSKSERRARNDSVGGGIGGGGSNSGVGGGNGASDRVNAVATPEAGSSPSNTTMVTVTSTMAGSRLLNLFGWQAMRDDLVSKEHMRFASVEAVSPVKHSNVQFLGVEPSAPEIDPAVPTAPMAAMAIPVHVPMAVMASAPMVFSVRATASAPDFEDMDDDEVFL